MQNRTPIGMKTRIRLLIGLTLLAWATQTLLQQWGYGQEVIGTAPTRFVPQEAYLRGGTLEVRSEATIIGGEVSLKQICRWSESDRDAFAAIENLVLLRMAAGTPYRTISLAEIKSTLHDAGVNLGRVRFVGATICTIARRDVTFDEGEALRQWVEVKDPANDALPAAAGDSGAINLRPGDGSPRRPIAREAREGRGNVRPIIAEPPGAAPAQAAVVEHAAYPRLRDLLIDALALAAGVEPEQLVVDFKPQDDRLLNLAEPHFRFHVALKRGKALGSVGWEVTIDADGRMQKAQISATARCWQQQLVVSRPVAHRQVIRDEDVLERRTLVDQLDHIPLLAREHTVGQMAATELRPGTVLNARMVEAVPLVKTGQLVSVTLRQGAIQIRSVGRALETGTYGQTIRVRNEATKDIFDVTLTGPQEAVMGGELPPSLASVAE